MTAKDRIINAIVNQVVDLDLDLINDLPAVTTMLFDSGDFEAVDAAIDEQKIGAKLAKIA